jgi:hypothetical protein
MFENQHTGDRYDSGLNVILVVVSFCFIGLIVMVYVVLADTDASELITSIMR